MNYIAGLLSASAIVVGAWSCTDLDEKTFDRIDASTYYQDENSVKGAVASIYSSAASGFLEYFWYLNELSADQIAWRSWNGGAWGYDEAEKFVLSTHTWNSESKIVRDAWTHAWETIGLCNLLINDLENLAPESVGVSKEKLDSYIAEVRTMRAWAYYNNFELWGGALPLNTSVGGDVPGSADPDFDKGCEKIWQFIADELDGCCSALPKEDGANATRNRINQGMNRMLKMRLLLPRSASRFSRATMVRTLLQQMITATSMVSITTLVRRSFSLLLWKSVVWVTTIGIRPSYPTTMTRCSVSPAIKRAGIAPVSYPRKTIRVRSTSLSATAARGLRASCSTMATNSVRRSTA